MSLSHFPRFTTQKIDENTVLKLYQVKKKIYKINDYILDGQSRRFFYKNKSIDLSSRAFDILYYLLEQRGEIVEKDKLLEIVWADSFVEENNLAVHISALRRILNEKKGESQFIKTISGRGYSFVAEVEEIESVNEIKNELNPSDALTTLNDEKNSIAVLPFTINELNSDLSQIPNLKVMAYSAVKNYKNSTLDLTEIGFILGVRRILTGHILDYKDKLEISVELVNTTDKGYLWGMQYEFQFTDILQIKESIILSIAKELKLHFSEAKKSKRTIKQNIASDDFKLYLKGKYILETVTTRNDLERDLNQALRFFRNALKKNPYYALAHVGVGETYFNMFNNNILNKSTCYYEVKKSLQLATKLDKRLSEIYILRGIMNIIFEGNISEARTSFANSLNLNENNSEAFHWLSFVNICFGNFETALSLEKKALSLNPTSIIYNNGLLRVFYFSEDYSKAVIQAEEILELDNRSAPTHFLLAMTYSQMGLFEEALLHIDIAIQLRSDIDAIIAKAYIYALMGDNPEVEKIIFGILSNVPPEKIDFTYLATVYSAMNDKDEAFANLEKSLEKGGPELILLKVNPKFKNLHGDPRFHDLLEKLNLK